MKTKLIMRDSFGILELLDERLRSNLTEQKTKLIFLDRFFMSFNGKNGFM